MDKKLKESIRDMILVLIMFNGITYMSLSTLKSAAAEPMLMYIVIAITALVDLKITNAYLK